MFKKQNNGTKKINIASVDITFSVCVNRTKGWTLNIGLDVENI